MKDFSYRRAAMFCRLQLEETYFNKAWKSAAWVAVTLVFIIALPMLSGRDGIREMMAGSEDLVRLFAATQIVFLYFDLISEGRAIDRMLVPATCLEKFVALYAGAAFLGIIILGTSVMAGSLMYLAAAHLMFPGQTADIPVFLFSEKSPLWTYILIFGLAPSASLWAIPFVMRKKKYGTAAVCGALAAYLAIMILPGMLRLAGVITAEAASIATAAVMGIFCIFNLRWGYVMLLRHESDRNANE